MALPEPPRYPNGSTAQGLLLERMSESGPTSSLTLPHRGAIPTSVVDGLPMPVLVSRISDDAVIRLNPEFSAAYGHRNADVEGTPSRLLHFVEEDRTRTLDRQGGGGLESVEVRLRSSTGECMWAQADIARFSLDGGDDVLLTTYIDIGARKEAEAQVVEMARFPEMNPGPVVRLDLDGTVRRSNAAARELFGGSVEGACFWDICPDFSEAARERIIAGGEPIREDVNVHDGWFRLTVTHPPDSDQIFVFGSDITKQKAAEEELAERARFPAMNPGAVARLAADGTVIRANPAASSLFGRESIRGMSWLELCPGIDTDTWDRARGEEGLVQHEADIGSRCFSFTLRHEPIADQVFVYGSDITELKSAQRALAELARVPDMNPGPVCRLDRDGRVVLANPAARTLFACEDLTGRSWLELVPTVAGDFWESLQSSGESTALEATIRGRQYVLTHAPGPEGVFIFVYGSDVSREKEAERALRQSEKMATLGTLAAGVAHELNNPAAAAQRAAEQLDHSFASLQAARTALGAVLEGEQADRIMEALDAKAREAASCPCELDPLERSDLEGAVEDWLDERGAGAPWEVAGALVEGGFDVAALEALADDVGDQHVGLVATWHGHAHRAYRLLEEIRHGTARLAEIVGAMKAYAYLGQAPLQNVDVNEGIRSTLVILRSKLKAGVVVHQELAPELPRIEAYGSELNQVWTNLIDNAADAMDGRGEIRLRSSLAGDRVVVEVEDDGPGIPEDHQSRVFDAFFTTKPPGKGTGLGLNTCYNIIVEKHTGSIRVDSQSGRTVFTVELPLRRSAPIADSGNQEDFDGE
jgi:PAS domain S-box-containing protein